ncbi:MAG: hypothetical protein ACYC4U_18265 [Pirellulaceae bacterium]
MESDVPLTDPSFRAPEDANHPHPWSSWPACAHCRRPRLTVCPICGMAGTSFPLAEYLAPAAPLQSSRSRDPDDPPHESEPVAILLMCPQCDEAFPPRFYRHCPECGHDAGEGLSVPGGAFSPLSDETLLVITGLLALLAALVMYLRWLFAVP